jgi:predicted phage terminase large subunit-like protein
MLVGGLDHGPQRGPQRPFSFSVINRKNPRYVQTLSGALLIEDSAKSKGLIQALKNNNVNVVTVTPDKEKRSRVIAQSDLFEGGSIFIHERAEWREIFIRELLDFPGARHDDQVDALVQGLAYQRGQWLRKIKVPDLLDASDLDCLLYEATSTRCGRWLP